LLPAFKSATKAQAYSEARVARLNRLRAAHVRYLESQKSAEAKRKQHALEQELKRPRCAWCGVPLPPAFDCCWRRRLWLRLPDFARRWIGLGLAPSLWEQTQAAAQSALSGARR